MCVMKHDAILYRHARLMRDAQLAGVAVEDIARALAAADGRLDQFDAGQGNLGFGIFAEYVIRAEQLIERATAFQRP